MGLKQAELKCWPSLQLLGSWVSTVLVPVLPVCVGLPFVYILTSVLWCQAHLSIWVLTYWIFEAPLKALSIRVDCLSWELCFVMSAIFSFPHMIAIFLPSFIYLAIPLVPKIAQKEALHPGSDLLLTVNLKGLLWASFWSCWGSISSVFGLNMEEMEEARLPFLICASTCRVCVVPISTRKQSTVPLKEDYNNHLSTRVQFTLMQWHTPQEDELKSCLTEGDHIWVTESE